MIKPGQTGDFSKTPGLHPGVVVDIEDVSIIKHIKVYVLELTVSV